MSAFPLSAAPTLSSFFQNRGSVFRLRFRICHNRRRILDSASPAAQRFGSRFRHAAFFALFKLAEVVAHGHADPLQRLFADARNLFQLLGRHVGQRLNGGDAGSDQLLDDAVAQLGHLLDRRGGSAG